MEPDGRWLDFVSAISLVVRAIDDIEQQSDEERDVLLGDLQCAAWGSPHAQNQ